MAVTAEEIQVLVTAEVDRALKDFQKIDKSVQKAESRFKKFGQTASKVGKTLTKTVTLPILAAGAATLKFAIDAEETAAKFNTAFAGIEEQAAITAEALAENYGLARQESEKLLAGTGDLLKGFGATASEALGLSNEVQELAVDMASYNNLAGGAKQASDILTKALLGEREALTTLGVKVSEADLKTELLRRGQAKLTGQAKLLARAEATLALVTQQSGDAQGDFARTSDSAANQLRVLKANAIDAATGLGEILLPAATALISGAAELVGKFSELDESTKKIIIGVAAVAAGTGPLIGAIGGAVKAVGGLKKAFTLLAANPAYLAVTAGVGLAAGIVAIAAAADEVEEYSKRIRDSGIAAGNAEQVIRKLFQVDPTEVFQIGKVVDIKEEYKKILAVIDNQVGALRASDQAIAAQLKNTKSLTDEQKRVVAEALFYRATLEDQAAAQKVQADESARAAEQEKKRLELLGQERAEFEKEYTVLLLEQSGDRIAILERERETALKEAQRLGADRAQVEKLFQNEIIKIQDEARAEQEAKRKEELAKINALKEQELAQEKANEAARRSFFISRLSQEQRQTVALNERIEELREAGVSEIELEKYKEEEKTRITAEETAKRKALIVQNLKAITSVTSTVLNQLAGINTDFYNSVKDNEENATEEKKKQARKAFEIAKAANIAQTLIATATGAIEAYKALAGIPFVGPALGIAAAAALTGFGLQKANQIRAQKPAFQEGTNAEGFRVPEGFPNDSFNVGLSSDEVVNVTQADEAGLGGESDIRQINLNIDGRTYGRIIFDLSKNKEVQLDSRAIVVT